MKINDLTEEATAGASTSGAIATVVNPSVANPNLKSYLKKGRKKNDPEDNALDISDNLMGGTQSPSIIKRPY